MLEQVLGSLLVEIRLERPANEVEPGLDPLLEHRRQLLGFHQYLLPYADLSEVVKESRVAQLSHLLTRELGVPVT